MNEEIHRKRPYTPIMDRYAKYNKQCVMKIFSGKFVKILSYLLNLPSFVDEREISLRNRLSISIDTIKRNETSSLTR